MDTLPIEALDTPVTGVRLVPGTLRDQLAGEVSLLVFLRHFSCIFCREVVGDLRAAAEQIEDFPSVLFFFQGSSTEGRAFLRRDWPEARAVADLELELYDLFGVRLASLLEALGPSVLAAGVRARMKGYAIGSRSGDIWRMPGVFAVRGEKCSGRITRSMQAIVRISIGFLNGFVRPRRDASADVRPPDATPDPACARLSGDGLAFGRAAREG